MYHINVMVHVLSCVCVCVFVTQEVKLSATLLNGFHHPSIMRQVKNLVHYQIIAIIHVLVCVCFLYNKKAKLYVCHISDN